MPVCGVQICEAGRRHAGINGRAFWPVIFNAVSGKRAPQTLICATDLPHQRKPRGDTESRLEIRLCPSTPAAAGLSSNKD